MKFKHIVLQSVALAALTLAGCTDEQIDPSVGSEQKVVFTIANMEQGRISRAETPVQEKGDPNEGYMHNCAIIITTAPINSGQGQVVKVLSFGDIPDAVNVAVDRRETELFWYDADGNAHSVYTNDQLGYRSTIRYQVGLNDTNFRNAGETLDGVITELANTYGEATWLYATAVANVDLSQFKTPGGQTKTIQAGMTVSEMRDLIYTGDLHKSNYGNFHYDPDNPSTKFPWGPTGYPGGDVRFHEFAMSAINEVKFQPKRDRSGRFTMPTLMVQRMAARIDIAFGVQAVDRYSEAERNNVPGRTNMPYITDRGWFYVGDPVIGADGKVTYPNADTNPYDHKTGPGNATDAPFEESFGAGFIGLEDCTTPPTEGYMAKYMYDMDVTGDDLTTGSPVRVLDTAMFDGVERPVKWGAEVKNGDAHLTVVCDSQGLPVSVDGYDSLPESVQNDLQYHYVITNLDDFRTKNYAGQYRFPIYDEEKFLAGEGDVLITGAVFYMQSIRLLNCVNSGVNLFEQANVGGQLRYMHNEGTWREQGIASYPDNFIYTPASRVITHRQLTTLDEFDHRPVPCIQSGLKVPASSRTLQAPNGDKHFGVYSILGYVGENTYEAYDPNKNKYTGIQIDGVTNLGHYFTDAEQLETNDGNLRTKVSVKMNLCHSFGAGGVNNRRHNMHFATVRNTVYRVYVKFYAKGTSLFVRYYFYDGSDNAFEEKEYERAQFYSLILEDDRYRPVVD